MREAYRGERLDKDFPQGTRTPWGIGSRSPCHKPLLDVMYFVNNMFNNKG